MYSSFCDDIRRPRGDSGKGLTTTDCKSFYKWDSSQQLLPRRQQFARSRSMTASNHNAQWKTERSSIGKRIRRSPTVSLSSAAFEAVVARSNRQILRDVASAMALGAPNETFRDSDPRVPRRLSSSASSQETNPVVREPYERTHSEKSNFDSDCSDHECGSIVLCDSSLS
eukprot:jgi/Psemu1/5387/gm1.5387_g